MFISNLCSSFLTQQQLLMAMQLKRDPKLSCSYSSSVSIRFGDLERGMERLLRFGLTTTTYSSFGLVLCGY